MGGWCDGDGKRVNLADMTAGTTVSDVVLLRDYPSSAWALSVALRGPQPIDIAGTPQPDNSWLISETSEATAAWVAGRYWFSVRVTNGGTVVEVGNGEMQILPNLQAIEATYDGRSEAEIALDAIDAILAKRATRDQERYRINNRELVRTPIKDLIALRAYYAVQVSRERAKKSGRRGFGRAVNVRFG
ncbi:MULTISPECIES: hypothetical protein [unclassified Acidocella]|uniref:hypothetical protein n=1 Tax=unclassified Acidocella TaxID=2648610 RepID=UPI00028E1C92|nr:MULTISPECIES: hypothetical protein [unclassified Acidocella]EKN01113.1 hypothetical protein MXAZACID_02369 [Acidocella sp. MX-AZ02]WBO60556.1 hypothetical protein GT370_07235 [Acidocella sp. MX-AZ03]